MPRPGHPSLLRDRERRVIKFIDAGRHVTSHTWQKRSCECVRGKSDLRFSCLKKFGLPLVSLGRFAASRSAGRLQTASGNACHGVTESCQ